MVRKTEYDFVNWTSFPSSIKAINDEEEGFAGISILKDHPVEGGETIRLDCMIKGENLSISHATISYWDGERWRRLGAAEFLPKGDYDWRPFSMVRTLGADAEMMRVTVWGGKGLTVEPALTWADDAKIYLDDVLIYENKFTAPLVKLAAGLTPVFAVGAVVGTQEVKRITQGIP